MLEYHFNVAIGVRAYGTALVEGTSPEDAASKLTAEIVGRTFEPYGAGNDDDFSFEYPTDIYCDGGGMDGAFQDFEIEGFTIPDGEWVKKDPVREAAPKLLEALKVAAELLAVTGPEAMRPSGPEADLIRSALATAEGETSS